MFWFTQETEGKDGVQGGIVARVVDPDQTTPRSRGGRAGERTRRRWQEIPTASGGPSSSNGVGRNDRITAAVPSGRSAGRCGVGEYQDVTRNQGAWGKVSGAGGPLDKTSVPRIIKRGAPDLCTATK